MAKSKSKRAPAGRGTAKRSASKAARKTGARASKKARPTSRRGAAPARAAAGTRRAKKAGAPKPRGGPADIARRRQPAARTATRPARRQTRKTTAEPRVGSSRTAAKATPSRRPPTLDRERRTIAESERAYTPTPPSSLDMDRSASAARSGRAEMTERLHEHTSTSPAMTAGDVDADWESAESVGDEAPGGDNPTPDQDVVDEIGRALGVEYDDDEELRGGDEIIERDRNRWELDPASSDDFDDRE